MDYNLRCLGLNKIRFKFRSTDTQLIVFNDGSSTPYLLVPALGFSGPITNEAGTPTVSIDGSTGWGSNRTELQIALCDGENHDVLISGILLFLVMIIIAILPKPKSNQL